MYNELYCHIDIAAGKIQHIAEINQHNLNEFKTNQPISIFDCKRQDGQIAVPDISLFHYIMRCFIKADLLPQSLIYSVVLIQRLIVHQNGKFLIVPSNMHRIIVTALFVSEKCLRDQDIPMRKKMIAAGISVKKEIALMELQFIKNLNLDLFVKEEEYEQWHDSIINEAYRRMHYLTRYIYPVACMSPIPSSPAPQLTMAQVVARKAVQRPQRNPHHITIRS
jgi:hypothetical protein